MYYEIEMKSPEILINIYMQKLKLLYSKCRIEQIHKEETHNSIERTRIF